MKPVVDRLESRYAGTVDLFMYREADKNPEAAQFAAEHRIQGVPTVVLVAPDGTELQRFVGATSEDRIAAALDRAVADAGGSAQ